MKITILEIAPHGHYTYVESITKIFSADSENVISIVTTSKGAGILRGIAAANVVIVDIGEAVQDAFALLDAHKNTDLLFVVTLEAYSKDTYGIMREFVKVNWQSPIFYVIHNLDFWFHQSFWVRLRNVFFHKIGGFSDFVYRLKINFVYANVNQLVVRTILKSRGRFVSLSETVGQELAKCVGTENVSVVPFSVFDGKIADNSAENAKIRVCLPGFVSAIRRDYFSIFKLLAEDTEGVLKAAVTWDFLGGISQTEGGIAIRDEALEWIKRGYDVKIYDKNMVGLEEFDENLAKSDLVLGNLILKQSATGGYGKSKESGLVFTMIKAAKPGLVPADYPVDDTMKSSVLHFNNYGEITPILLHLRRKTSELAALKLKALDNAQQYTPLSIYRKLSKELGWEQKS